MFKAMFYRSLLLTAVLDWLPRLAIAMCLVGLPACNGQAAGATFRNPLLPGNLADPAVIRHEGRYYLYATGDVEENRGTRVYTSTNLVDWERGPIVFQPGQKDVWAPDVWRDPGSGRFYLYYTASLTVGVAEADHPLGPFSVRKKFFDKAIDAHLFRDDDGRLFLYYVQLPGFRIMVQPMANPVEPAGEPRDVLHPQSPWEVRNGHVTEGPWMIKRAGRYHLLYSGSGADTPDYAVGYATADSPMGPFTRAPHNPIITRGGNVLGPGHGCAIQDDAGQWWHIYHQKSNDGRNYDRFVAMDRLGFDQHGHLHGAATREVVQIAPVVAAQPLPRQFDPFLWKSEPPPDCPFPLSTSLTGIVLLGQHSDYRVADTWYPSWAADGNLYSPWTDGELHGDGSSSDAVVPDADSFGGFRIVRGKATTGQAAMVGDDPLDLKLVNLGKVQADPHPYGGRYPCGSLVHNSIWYYGTYCLSPSGQTTIGDTIYNWPWLGPLVGFRVSRDLGRTWQETPHTPAKPLFGETGLWGSPLTIGAPHFVDFGRNMEHSPDGMAYLVAQGATPKDPTPRPANLSWITADHVYLLRVKPSPETINDPAAYEFFGGADGDGRPRWTRALEDSRPLLEWNNHLGCVTATYVAPLKKYLLFITDGGNTCARMSTTVLEADVLTGPWRMVSHLKDFGQQAYFVNLPSKFISTDGRTAWLCYSGNFATDWNNEKIRANPPGSRYGLVLQRIRLLGESQP